MTLIDAQTCAAVGGMSMTSWYELVKAGRAPAPVIQRHRFTRYRLIDVEKFWRDYVTAAAADANAAAVATARAKMASDAARAKKAIVAEKAKCASDRSLNVAAE